MDSGWSLGTFAASLPVPIRHLPAAAATTQALSPSNLTRAQRPFRSFSALITRFTVLVKKSRIFRQLRHNHPQLEILVYDDASSDGTYELLSAAADVLTVIRGPGPNW